MDKPEGCDFEEDRKFHFELDSTKKDICDFKTLIYSLLPNSVSSDNFSMALHEIVVNAAEHGNQMEADKKVIVDLEIKENLLYAVVQDQGPGFNWKKNATKKFNMGENSDRGRGIMMTAKACDDFYYNDKGNIAYLTKKIEE